MKSKARQIPRLKKPDQDVEDYNRQSGVWSIYADMAFDEHLVRLQKYVRGEIQYEPKWYP